jgi:hypothetical protein
MLSRHFFAVDRDYVSANKRLLSNKKKENDNSLGTKRILIPRKYAFYLIYLAFPVIFQINSVFFLEAQMKTLKAFIAGIVFPSILLPALIFALLTWRKPQLLQIFFLHLIPLIWGIWNVSYFAIWKKILPGSLNVRLLVTGALLGLLVAIYGVFWLQVPTLLGMPKNMFYLPLVGAPILYAIAWRLFVKPINDLLGLTDN